MCYVGRVHVNLQRPARRLVHKGMRRPWLGALLACAGLAGHAPAQERAGSGSPPLPWLRADGVNVVDPAGKRVALKGFNLNGAFVFEA